MTGESAYFRHHLFHDALAARALVSDPTRWNSDCFDAITFEANSFDALAFALEMIDEPVAAEEMLLAIYDWNFYASAFALGRGQRLGTVAVSRSTTAALLALLAERRWDPFRHTVQGVEDALRVFHDDLAGRLLATAQPSDVLEIVREESTTWSGASGEEGAQDNWVSIYLDEVEEAALLEILTDGPLLAWMASNVLRRHTLRDASQTKVLELLEHEDPTTRWRSAHVLGTVTESRVVESLLERLDKDDSDGVRYGSVRSVVEIAYRSPKLRQGVFESLDKRLSALRKERKVFKELQRCLVLREPPTDWIETVTPLVEDLWAMESTIDDQDHWRRVGQRIVESVADSNAAYAA